MNTAQFIRRLLKPINWSDVVSVAGVTIEHSTPPGFVPKGNSVDVVCGNGYRGLVVFPEHIVLVYNEMEIE